MLDGFYMSQLEMLSLQCPDTPLRSRRSLTLSPSLSQLRPSSFPGSSTDSPQLPCFYPRRHPLNITNTEP
jgi:hypothetical protein